MTSMTIDFPDSAFAVFKKTPRELAEDVKIAAVVKWYEEGLISQSKAAEISGISRARFLDCLRDHKVSPFQLTPDELEDECR